MMTSRVALVAIAITSFAWEARASDTQRCVDAHVEAQALRKSGDLVGARSKLSLCSDGCPAIVAKDCETWSREVGLELPAFLVRASDSTGSDVELSRVEIDGVASSVALEAGPVELNPGVHTVRVFAEGYLPAEQRVTLKPRDKGHVSSGPPRQVRALGPKTIIVGAVGLAGIASFATFAGLAKARYDDLRSTCAPSCSEDEVSSVRTRALIADVSLGVGLLALGGAAWLQFGSAGSATRARIAALPSTHGLVTTFEVTY